MKNRNSETCWKPSILFPRVVSAFQNGEITSSTIVQKLKIMTGMDLRNKMKIDNFKPVGNHPYYFIQWSDHVQQTMKLVVLS